MKFVFRDNDPNIKMLEEKEFSSLDEFLKWSYDTNLPRHVYIPPNDGANYKNDCWMIYCYSQMDEW